MDRRKTSRDGARVTVSASHPIFHRPPHSGRNPRRHVAFAAAFFLASLAGFAGETVQLDVYEVIEHPTGADERTAAVWVVTPEEGAPPPARISDFMTQVPGVHIDRAGGPGGRSTIYLRGTEENHTLVLLDGVPLNDLTDSRGGGVDFSAIDPSLVEKIAVVRGPASVRHGPEVLGGIAHIETTREGDGKSRVGAEIGTDHFRRGHADGRFTFGQDGSFNLGGAISNEGSIEDGGRTQLQFARASFAVKQPVEIRGALWHLRHRADAFPDDSGGERLAVLRELEHRDEQRTGLSFSARGLGLGGAWTASADAALFDVLIDNPGVAPGVRDPAGLPPIVSDTRLRRYRASFVHDRAGAGWSLAAGFDVQHESGRDDSEIDFGGFTIPAGFSLDRTRAGVFVEGTRNLTDNILAAAGGRFDRFDGEFSRGTARIGLLGSFNNDKTQWRFNAGTAFKPPSFYGLAHPLVGNPDLEPESVRTFEIGLRQPLGDGNGLIDFTLFTTRTRNAVDFEAGPPPRVVNIDGLRSQGAELACTTRLTTAWTVRGAVAYSDARSRPDDERMRSRPRWRGDVALTWSPMDALRITGRIVAVGSTPDSSIATGDVVLGSWARADLAASWAFAENTHAIVSIDNLLDREYEEVVGFPAQGRRLRAGVELRF
ncbi:MAG: TonB-dependent receptor [Opitutaceae bacterium]